MKATESLHVNQMQACKPDWNLIQSLYFKGFTPKQISEQTGVKALNVSVQASRKGWRKALLETSAIVVKRNAEVQGEDSDSKSLAKSSNAVRAGLADVLTRSVEKIQAIAFKTPKAALKANQELESVVRNAKTVFGWSEGQTQPSVRISVMANAVTISEGEVKPVIDVESVPALPDAQS